MFKTIKAILNSLNEKPYLKNINDLKLYDLSSKNRVMLKNTSREMIDVERLERGIRHQNLKIYVKNIARIRGIQTLTVTLPAILCAGTILSFNAGKTLKTKSLDTYKKDVIDFDEEYLYQDGQEDTVYTYNFSTKKFVDENTANLGSKEDNAIIYFGDGANTVKVVYNISNNDVWRVKSSFVNNYVDLEKRDSTKAEEVDEKYSKLIEEAANIYINYLRSNTNMDAQEIEEREKLLEEAINNEKNDIRVMIEQYIENGKMDLTYYRNPFWYIIVAIALDIIYGFILYQLWAYDFLDTIGSLSANNYNLEEMKIHLNPNDFFYAPTKYREAYLKAEKERILAIKEILKSHDGSSDILSQYEKKLIKKEEE